MQAPRAPATYQVPEWGGAPSGCVLGAVFRLALLPPRIEYGLEVTKGGVVIEEHALADKDHYTFGRTPNNGAWKSAIR